MTDLEFASGLEIIDLRAAFTELRGSLKQLLWYWLVNLDKIIGSLAKFQGDLCASDADLAVRTESVGDLCQVNEWLKRMRSGSSHGSAETTLLQRKHFDQSLFHLPLKNAFAAIEQDDTLGLDQQLRRTRGISEIDLHSWQQLLFALLHFSAVSRSQQCTLRLLSDIGYIQDYGDHIHWLIIRIGRSKGSQDQQSQTAVSGVTTETTTRLGFKLEQAFQTKGSLGKIPLHHAVQYDLPRVCQQILKHMSGIRGPHSIASPSPALIPDRESLASLELAVISGNDMILSILLEDHHRRMEVARTENRHFSRKTVLPGNLLTTALELGSFAIVRLLCKSVIDVKHTDYNGNTVLHLAVRSGKIEYVTEILQACKGNSNLNLDAREVVYGWTALILASARGDSAVVELLLPAGADPKTPDHIGWKANDHAATKLTGLIPEHSKDEDDVHRLHQQRRPTTTSGLSANLTALTLANSAQSELDICQSWRPEYL